jgi:hypothetical protein
MTELTFAHKFSRTISVTVRVPDQKPEPDGRLDLTFEWVGWPKPKHTAEYRQWMLSTIQILCDRWQVSILYCLGATKRETEAWGFEPGCPPKLIKKLVAGLP